MCDKATEETIATKDKIAEVISKSFTVIITFRKSKIKEATDFFAYMIAMDYISYDKRPKLLDEDNRRITVNGFGGCARAEIIERLISLVEVIEAGQNTTGISYKS